MSNIEYELFKNNLLQRPITFLTEENLDKLETHCRRAIRYERGVEHQVVLELLERHKEHLAERVQDKKRIKELEEDNLHWRGQYLIALDEIGMIPKQKVIDRINYCDERIKHAKQIRDKEQEEFYTDLKRAFNKLLEEK